MSYLEIRQQKLQEKKLKDKQTKTKIMYKSIYRYLGFILFFYVIFMVVESRVEIYLLNHKGTITEANITDIRSTGSKGAISTHYSFYVGNKKYDSKSVNIKNHQVGDRLKIVYLAFCPSINESLVHLQEFR